MEMETDRRNVLRLTFTFCVLENIVVFVRPPPDAEYLFSKSKHFPSVSIFHPGPCAQLRGIKLLIRKLLI